MATYLCVFHLATAGLNGALLGTDEEEVVLVCFTLVNAITNQVVTVEEHWVKPRSADNYENVLSELTKEELGLSEEQIRKGNSLEDVISKLEECVKGVVTKNGVVSVVSGDSSAAAANAAANASGLPAGTLLSPECIQIHRNSDGRPSGEAVVNFQNHAEAERAIQVKNRHNIGARYIELFMA